LPENLPGKSCHWRGNFIQQLAGMAGAEFSTASRAVSLGRAAGLHAIDLAHKYLAVSERDFVLVGGVDTFFDPDLLARLDAEDRLNVEGAMDGFIPGEGAAFILLARDAAKDRLPKPHVAVGIPGHGSELGHYYSAAPCLGEGMAAAVAQAIANSGSAPIAELWTTINGEQF